MFHVHVVVVAVAVDDVVVKLAEFFPAKRMTKMRRWLIRWRSNPDKLQSHFDLLEEKGNEDQIETRNWLEQM